MVGADQETGSLALEPLAEGRDLLRRSLLLRQQVVQPEDHQRVRIRQDPLVDRLPIAGLVDPLEDGDGLVGGFAYELLKAQRGAVKQLQRAGNALQEGLLVPFPGFILGPGHPPNLGEGGEAVVHDGRVAVRFPGIAPGPVDAHPTLAGLVLARHMILVVGPRRFARTHMVLRSRLP